MSKSYEETFISRRNSIAPEYDKYLDQYINGSEDYLKFTGQLEYYSNQGCEISNTLSNEYYDCVIGKARTMKNVHDIEENIEKEEETLSLENQKRKLNTAEQRSHIHKLKKELSEIFPWEFEKKAAKYMEIRKAHLNFKEQKQRDQYKDEKLEKLYEKVTNQLEYGKMYEKRMREIEKQVQKQIDVFKQSQAMVETIEKNGGLNSPYLQDNEEAKKAYENLKDSLENPKIFANAPDPKENPNCLAALRNTLATNIPTYNESLKPEVDELTEQKDIKEKEYVQNYVNGRIRRNNKNKDQNKDTEQTTDTEQEQEDEER